MLYGNYVESGKIDLDKRFPPSDGQVFIRRLVKERGRFAYLAREA